MSKSRFITCVDTGEQALRENCYYVPKMKRYFSSEEAFLKWNKPDEYWGKVIKEFIDIVDYPSKMKLPGRFLKKLRDEYKGVGFEPVYLALVAKRKEIDYRMQINEFPDYTRKLNYILAMIEGDVPAIAKQLEYLKYNKHEKSFDSNEGSEIIDLEIPENHKGGKDLSSLVFGE